MTLSQMLRIDILMLMTIKMVAIFKQLLRLLKSPENIRKNQKNNLFRGYREATQY